MRSTTAQSTIDQMKLWFAAYGLPEEVISDNGPQFISQELTDFLKQNGVKQTLVPCTIHCPMGQQSTQSRS